MKPDDLFSANELYQWVTTQAAFGQRRPGSPAGKTNETYLFNQLVGFGLKDVRLEPTEVSYWEPHQWSFKVGNRSFDAFGIPHTTFTSPQGLSAPLVYGRSNDFFAGTSWKGKIVVAEIEFPSIDNALLQRLALGTFDPEDTLKSVTHPATWIRLGWHIYQWAMKRGAAGFVGILKNQPGGTSHMYAPYGFKEKNILDKKIPGLWIGRDEGADLLSLAKTGAVAHLTLAGRATPAISHNIVAEIPGQTSETIVLSCHHDSPFTSPVEDGTGVSVILALAKHFAKGPAPLRRIVILLTAGHFYGSIGTRTFIAKHRRETVARTVLEISVEHIALEAIENAAGKLVPSGLPEAVGMFVPFSRALTALILRLLIAHDLKRCLLLPPEGPLGDYPPTDGGDWYQAGVPVINYISNPVYLLTDDDALQWVDRQRLATVATFFVRLVEQLDHLTSREIGANGFRIRKFFMRLLKHLVKCKTTWAGLKPVH